MNFENLIPKKQQVKLKRAPRKVSTKGKNAPAETMGGKKPKQSRSAWKSASQFSHKSLIFSESLKIKG